MSRNITWRQEESIAVVSIDNPPVNALSPYHVLQLIQCFKEIEPVEEIRVVILSSALDKYFAAGADISDFPGYLDSKPGFIAGGANQVHELYCCLERFPKPVIAAVQGLALGGGFELILCCDLCVADETARFGLPEVKLGLTPGSGGTQRLPRRIGKNRAKEYLFLGDFIGAEDALRFGLVNRLVPSGHALEEARKLAVRIAKQPPAAVGMIKESVNRGYELPLEQGLKVEADLFERAFRTGDAQKAITSYMARASSGGK